MATLIFKPTLECNSNCAYCDVVKSKQYIKFMSLDMLELVFIRIDEFLRQNDKDLFDITWHGGEPLLMGPEYFEAAWHYQEKHCSQTSHRIRHQMQTNLTLFTADFVSSLHKLGINSFGTSYDPLPNIRGPGEEIDSTRYNKMFMQGLSQAERFGFQWGMIYVVTKKSLESPFDIFYHLTNLNPSGSFSLNPVLFYNDCRKDIEITPEEYVDFLGAIFPVWWKNQIRFKNIEPFCSLTNSIQKGIYRLCCGDSGHCSSAYVNIGPDGECSHCGRSADWGFLSYGNIRDNSLNQIFANPKRSELAARNAVLFETECSNCRFWIMCHGGCPLDSFSHHKSFMHKTSWCFAKKGFIENYFEPITGIKFKPNEK